MYPTVPETCPGARERALGRLRLRLRGSPGRGDELCQAEVEQLDCPLGAHDDVRRLQVSMDDAAAVGPGQRVRDRGGDSQHLAERHSLPRYEPVQALAGHVLHDDEIAAFRGLDLVDRDDVRMVEGGGGAGFLDEAAPAGLVGEPIGGEHLDRNLAAEPGVARAVDLAHPTRAEAREDLVHAETMARAQAQWSPRRISVGDSSRPLDDQDRSRALPSAARMRSGS
jgi:hypothetical protein